MTMNRPFNPNISRLDPLRDFRRLATVRALAHLRDRTVDQIAVELYGKDGSEAVLKAAASPAGTEDWGSELSSGVRVAAFLDTLRPQSAASQLIERGMRVDLSGVGSATIPSLSVDYPEPAWVAEGAPIPAYGGTLGSVTLTPKKLAAIAGLTAELAELSAQDAERLIDATMRDAAAKALDASVLSDTAASALRPAGVLNGVSPLTATTGGGPDAFLGDLRALVGAVHQAGGGNNIVLVAAPEQAIVARVLGGASLETPIIPAPSLSAGTVVALEARAFASGFSDVPRVDIAKEGTIHWDDTTPSQISTAGSPNVIAAPVRSGFQDNTHALRLVMRAAWTMRAPMIAWVSGATW